MFRLHFLYRRALAVPILCPLRLSPEGICPLYEGHAGGVERRADSSDQRRVCTAEPRKMRVQGFVEPVCRTTFVLWGGFWGDQMSKAEERLKLLSYFLYCWV